jgi:glycosyltransferase involved in cell wall biosynthesis
MPLRVCCVALNAYPAIDRLVAGPIGGIETRSWLFARGLARRSDMQVSFVVRRPSKLRQSSYENVQLILMRDRLYAYRESLMLRMKRSREFPWVRLLEPRVSDAWALPLLALRKVIMPRPDPFAPSPFYRSIDADVFLTFGVQSNSAAVIASAHAEQKPAVLFLGSDGDLDERYLLDSAFVSTYRDSSAACLWTIQNADDIFCQTPSQQQRLLERFQREGTVIRNPIDLDEWDRLAAEPIPVDLTLGLKRYALWVGRAEGVHKRPLLLLDVARKCPEVDFLMILNRRDDALEAQVRRDAPANVHIVERVPFSVMPAIMRRAAVLVNTSLLEGFPNTYLQAAASGVPVASQCVEAGFLKDSASGICAGGDLDALAAAVQRFWNGTAEEDDFSAARARAYVERNYSLNQQVEQLAQSLLNVSREGSQG